ncbi:MAG: acyl-CoA dehydrogenase family protein, partial [Pseudomonadota bacterium]
MALDTNAGAQRAVLDDLLGLAAGALDGAEKHLAAAKEAVAAQVVVDGRPSGSKLEREQTAAHGLAWVGTYVESLRQMLDWAKRLESAGKFGEMEQLILQICYGEYLAQLQGGVMMSQGELARPVDLYLSGAEAAATPEALRLMAAGAGDAAKKRLVELILERDGSATYGDAALDEEFEMIRDQFKRFSDEKVLPYAHEWHLKDELVPMEVLQSMAELGVFGLTIPEQYGGFGMAKTAMCVVSEELSRGYIGVGSLGTRSEIAAELIICGGTEEQKQHFLPKLASAEILPTAVFTEPNTGSDLGSLKTKAKKDGDTYVITGNKTWITHAARTDLMTVLARTDPNTTDWRGLSMFLAPKTRGDCANPFPDKTLDGGEIEVLGYRGMKEYTLALDDHVV